jgi:transposase InsO family protein
VHVCVDNATRLAPVEVLADEKATSAAGFLRRAVAFCQHHGINVDRVMSDNGSCYRSTIHALASRTLGLRHLRTRPYRPRTNGKAERPHPHAASRLGLRRHLRLLRRTHRRSQRLALDLQSRPTTRLAQPQPSLHLNEPNNLAGSYSY